MRSVTRFTKVELGSVFFFLQRVFRAPCSKHEFAILFWNDGLIIFDKNSHCKNVGKSRGQREAKIYETCHTHHQRFWPSNLTLMFSEQVFIWSTTKQLV